MTAYGCGVIDALARRDFGDDITIDWNVDMSETDREYIFGSNGLNISPTNYYFTGKKAVIYDQHGDILDQWFELAWFTGNVWRSFVHLN